MFLHHTSVLTPANFVTPCYLYPYTTSAHSALLNSIDLGCNRPVVVPSVLSRWVVWVWAHWLVPAVWLSQLCKAFVNVGYCAGQTR